MNISEPRYFLFLGIVFVLYYALAGGAPRRILLLAASYLFYFEVSHLYVAVLLLLTAITYRGALLLGTVKEEQRSTTFFFLAVALTLLPLLVFKYLGPLLQLMGDHVTAVGSFSSHLAQLVTPVGISFFTFAALGYLIDVYLEVADPEHSLQRVSLFLAFFPLITAGPIERASFMAQFDLDNKFSAQKGLDALRLILIGLVMKLLLSDVLSVPVDAIYAAPGKCTPLQSLLGAIDTSFFYYTDFAGYTLIAIGSAQLFGLKVRPNFTEPFLSATVPEFWRHWHMSLSFWVRDYIFTPLRTSLRKLGQMGMIVALFISIVVIGVWHGAKWGYLAFGLMHATFVVTSSLTLAKRDAFWKAARVPMGLIHFFRVIITFCLVTFTLVVSRADTITDACTIYGKVFSLDLWGHLGAAASWFGQQDDPALVSRWIYQPFLVIALIVASDILVRKKITVDKFPAIVQWVLYVVATIEIVNSWINTFAPRPFIYNKF